jgi:hypothetical protein
MTELTEPTELDLLKQRADDMEIGYHPKIGVAKLKAKIEAQLAPTNAKAPDALVATNNKRQELKLEATRLIRVLVMNQNPTKKEWRGEYLGVSNKAIGTIRKFIPYDIETHVEAVLVKNLKARKMSRFYTEKNERNQSVRKYRLVPEFSITMLDPLTPQELKDLAEDQTKRGAIGAIDS